MSFARLRPAKDFRPRLKELKAFAQAQIAAHAKRRDRHKKDKMVLASLEHILTLFYHGARLGPGFDDDGWNMISVRDTRAYDEAAHEAMKAAVLATEAMDRELDVRWGNAEAGSTGFVAVTLVGSDHQATAGDRFKPFYKVHYQTGDYFDDDAFKPREQLAGWRAALEAFGLTPHFGLTDVKGDQVPTLAPGTPTVPVQVAGYTAAELPSGGRTYRFGCHDESMRGGKHLMASVSTGDLTDTGEALGLADQAVAALRHALGPPGVVTLEFDIVTQDLPRYAPILQRMGPVFPMVEVSGGFRSKFDPLKPQAVAPDEVWAYPLLLWKRYENGIAPISPMLAVNAVHAGDGLWIELQSCLRPDLIGEAARILGGGPEDWTGPPEARWGWYA